MKLRAGAVISARELVTIRSKRIQLPDPAGVVHQWSVDDLLHLASWHSRAIDHRVRT